MPAGFTHFRLVTRNNMKSLTTGNSAGYSDRVAAGHNIDCESGIIFDSNNEDKTDSAALLPGIEQAREDIRTLRQLQLQHQNR